MQTGKMGSINPGATTVIAPIVTGIPARIHVYQVGLSPAYIQDVSLRESHEHGFIRIILFSRFRNAAYHQLWVAFNEEYGQNDVETEDEPPIQKSFKNRLKCEHRYQRH